jgi:hypothetical protein
VERVLQVLKERVAELETKEHKVLKVQEVQQEIQVQQEI